jgi:hypothetical protein
MITLTTPITLTGTIQSSPVTITQVRISGISGDPDLANYALQLEPRNASGIVAIGPASNIWTLGAAGKAAFTATVGSGFRAALYAALQADSAQFAGTVT